MHQAIFWGMVVLVVGTALATVDQDFTNLLFDFQILRGSFYRLFELALDVFGVVLDPGPGDGRLPPLPGPARTACRPTRTRISLWDAFPVSDGACC